jgi:hypothetical protein
MRRPASLLVSPSPRLLLSCTCMGCTTSRERRSPEQESVRHRYLKCRTTRRCRLLWSRSPHATADIFASLKSNQDEPDPAAAALVGVPLGPDGVPLPLQPGAPGQQQQAGGGPAAALEAVVNQPALELLRRLPGVNGANYAAACSVVVAVMTTV